MTEPWLKIGEVAARLRVSVRTVENLKLPRTKVGRQNRYFMSQVEAALSGQETPDNVVPLRPRQRERAA
jgi:hypothetical protein